MPPVDEATFIAKADQLIAKLELLAIRMDSLVLAVSDFRTSSSLNMGALASRIQQLEVIETENTGIARADQQRDEAVLTNPVRIRRDNRGTL